MVRAAELLDPSTLRHLAAVIDARDPERVSRSRLSAEGVDRLADILLAGSRPTVGFWLRYRIAS
jgi:hypothetical protein